MQDRCRGVAERAGRDPPWCHRQRRCSSSRRREGDDSGWAASRLRSRERRHCQSNRRSGGKPRMRDHRRNVATGAERQSMHGDTSDQTPTGTHPHRRRCGNLPCATAPCSGIHRGNQTSGKSWNGGLNQESLLNHGLTRIMKRLRQRCHQLLGEVFNPCNPVIRG